MVKPYQLPARDIRRLINTPLLQHVEAAAGATHICNLVNELRHSVHYVDKMEQFVRAVDQLRKAQLGQNTDGSFGPFLTAVQVSELQHNVDILLRELLSE